MILANAFYAEVAAARNEIDEARRRRRVVIDFYEQTPDDPFAIAARAYSCGKLAVLDGDLADAEMHYRAAADGFAQMDRPVMLSITLDAVAEFDERAGDYGAAVRALDTAIATNDACGLRGYTGTLFARLGWALLHVGEIGRAELNFERAVEGARRVRDEVVLLLALTGMAVVHRAHGRNDAAFDAATEALDLYRLGHSRRFRSRVDPKRDLPVAAAACHVVLAAIAAERDDPEQAATRLGQASRLRAHAGAMLPGFQEDDEQQARTRATDALGADAFTPAYERAASGAEELPDS